MVVKTNEMQKNSGADWLEKVYLGIEHQFKDYMQKNNYQAVSNLVSHLLEIIWSEELVKTKILGRVYELYIDFNIIIFSRTDGLKGLEQFDTMTLVIPILKMFLSLNDSDVRYPFFCKSFCNNVLKFFSDSWEKYSRFVVGSRFELLNKNDKEVIIQATEKILRYLQKTQTQADLNLMIIRIMLGHEFRFVGKYEQSKELLVQGITDLINNFNYAEDNPTVIISRMHLGATYRELGEYEKSSEELKKAILVLEKKFNNDHMFLAEARVELAITQKRLGQHEQSKKLFDEGYTALQKTYSPNSEIMLRAIRSYNEDLGSPSPSP